MSFSFLSEGPQAIGVVLSLDPNSLWTFAKEDKDILPFATFSCSRTRPKDFSKFTVFPQQSA